ncbi:MAG: hypothetical protein KAQ85_10250, partial [Thermodesulfovibrionia bacterium]|nr:hypothetical protein [Thermodesulfovibrionia bacterium]
MSNKSTHWVTIPEETIHTPASGNSKDSGNGIVTKNKIFWGTGFVALLIFTATLLAPRQVISILRGDILEDQGFKSLELIPDFDEQENAFIDEEPEEVVEEVIEESSPLDDVVVSAETDSVSISIEPVTSLSGVEPVEEVDEPVTDDKPETIKEELDANRQLLEELSAQIAEMKEKDDEKTQIIEDLSEIALEQMEKQALHTSAPVVPTYVPSYPSVATTTSLGQLPSGYRLNTHIVTITPQQVLLQNIAQMQAPTDTAYAAVQPEAQQLYQAQLSGAQGTPESGPKEALLFALTLSFLA